MLETSKGRDVEIQDAFDLYFLLGVLKVSENKITQFCLTKLQDLNYSVSTQ